MAVMTVGVTQSSLRSLLGTAAAIKTGLGPAMLAASKTELLAAAERFRDEIKVEFKRGTDKHGQSHDKTGATLDSFHVEPYAAGAFIVGEHGAAYVQEGTPPHTISAKASDGFLMFESPEYGFVKKKDVHHPGYKGDDYVGRAFEHLNLDGFAMRVASAAYASLFLRSVGA